ncbi:unnamed protein product [Trichobilharzia szidati]|nr:unnamed protein product [Trichobilharzia szidati]
MFTRLMYSWSSSSLFGVIAISCLHSLYALPIKETPPQQFGLIFDEEIKQIREKFRLQHGGDSSSSNFSMYSYEYFDKGQSIHVTISIPKSDLEFVDDYIVRRVTCMVKYSSPVPLALSYDMDFTVSVELVNRSWHWLPPSMKENNINITVYMMPKLLGLDYLIFWIRKANTIPGYDVPIAWFANDSESFRKHYFNSLSVNYISNVSSNIIQNNDNDDENNPMGFPVIVVKYKGTGHLIFRIFVIFMVTVFTFTMGCELDVPSMRDHFKRPIPVVIGFFCQFGFMPLIAFSIAKIIPIKPEFGFGLLTIGCSPGGGVSNAWCLLLGGDINLSIVMTFISTLSALFMMPLLLFAYGRFFIDVTTVKIPYLNIVFQLLQVAVPALLGLGLRVWKPKWATKFTKLTRPLFIFFIVFFLTIGTYINWSLFRLLGVYPIVIATGALLPWFGFSLAALFALILRQSRKLIVTVALETGIQNIGVAILVLLYSMPKPAGELGAIIPITVAMFTPLPLYFIYLGLVIKRKCCDKHKTPTPSDPAEREALNSRKTSSSDSGTNVVLGNDYHQTVVNTNGRV